MKERGTCISCKNFNPSEESVKGFCSVRKEQVARSRIICAFDYISRDELNKRSRKSLQYLL